MNKNVLFFYGITLGAVVALVFCQALSGFLKDWQTLLAGLLALAGAWMTIRQMRKSSEDERARKQRAALFPLGNALSEVCSYARNGMSYLIELEERESSFDEAISRETIEALQGIAEWFEGEVSQAAGVIGPKYQLCHARGHGDVSGQNDYYRIGVILDFAELHALASRLFDLSRAKSDSAEVGPLTQQEIFSSFGVSDNVLWRFREREDVGKLVLERYVE